MKIQKLRLICFFLLSMHALPLSGQDVHLTYKVKSGDTLSEILAGLNLSPLWRSHNYVMRTVELNPQLEKSGGHRIYPNQIIILPIKVTPLQQKRIEGPSLASDEEEEIGPRDQEDQKESLTFGRLNISYDFFYSAMDIKDTTTSDTANILSRVNSALQIAWEQQWDKANKSFLYYRSEKHDYESLQGRLKGKSFNLQGFGFGYERSMTESFDLRLKYQVQERLFVRATSMTDLVMEKSMIQEFELNPRYTLFSKGKFILTPDVSYAYLFPVKNDNYSIKRGQRYTAGLSLKHDIGEYSLMGRYFYGVEKQDTSIMTKTTKATGISVGIAWSFGK